jgi:cysteine desulfuration protein SufE
MSTIADIQNEIVAEFEILGDDRESTIFYIMELGRTLEPYPESYRKDEYIIQGLVAMMNQMKRYALAFQTKQNA